MRADTQSDIPYDDLLEDEGDGRGNVKTRPSKQASRTERTRSGQRKKLLYSKKEGNSPGAEGREPGVKHYLGTRPVRAGAPLHEEDLLEHDSQEPWQSGKTPPGQEGTTAIDHTLPEDDPLIPLIREEIAGKGTIVPPGEELRDDDHAPALEGKRGQKKRAGSPRTGLPGKAGVSRSGAGPGSSATSRQSMTGAGEPGNILLDDDDLLDGDAGGLPGISHTHEPGGLLLDDGNIALSPDPRGLSIGFGKRNGNGSSIPVSVPSNGKKPGFLSGIAGIFSKKVKGEMISLPFIVGPLDEPSLEGALRDVNVTYPVNDPFQYVHIGYHNDEGALRYEVREPPLSDDEIFALSIVEKGFEKMISTNLDLIAGGDRVGYLKDRFLSIITIFGITATDAQKERMFFHLCKKYLGFSHMDTLMKDKYIEDISCNGSGINLYVMHRIYGSIQTNVRFAEVELNNFVLRLAQVGGRHISLLQPIRDVTLPDGSRANLTLGGEVTKKGSTFTIRKFRTNPISPIEMMEYGTIDAQQLAYLWILMEYKRSILVSGGTATGKTTMLNVLCSFIPSEYKIVSIEDTAELNLLHPNWIQSVTRTGFGAGESSASNLSGVSGISRRAPGDISLYDLLVAALRQRPEFIIVGEVRGDEAFTLFQAIAVGHAALGTIHAGSINELLARIESNPMNVPRALFSNLDAVIFPMHIMRGERSARRVANITEVLELDRDTNNLITNTSFKWVPDRDEFRFQGRTYLFDKIKDTYGISKDSLRSELDNRVGFLQWLQSRGVKDYHQVTRMIRHYQRNRDLVLDRVRCGGEIADLLDEEIPGFVPGPTLTGSTGEQFLLED
jgi:flagellar protein FlaI